MIERPILYSSPMVQAIFEDRKDLTRRIIKPGTTAHDWLEQGFTPEFVADKDNGLCKYGYAADVLWVRETWAPVFLGDELHHYVYKADDDPLHKYIKWKPSIHMPKAACRIKLLIKNVRIERLQDITEEDAVREGMLFHTPVPGDGLTIYKDYLSEGLFFNSAVYSFESLWKLINGPESWDHDPWVWVIEFERMENGGAGE